MISNKKYVIPSLVLVSLLSFNLFTMNISATDIESMTDTQLEEYVKKFENMKPDEIENYFKESPSEKEKLQKAREKLGLSTDLMIIYSEKEPVDYKDNQVEKKEIKEIDDTSTTKTKKIDLVGEVDINTGAVNLNWLKIDNADKYNILRSIDNQKTSVIDETRQSSFKDYDLVNSTNPNRPNYQKTDSDGQTGILLKSNDSKVQCNYIIEALNKKGEKISTSDVKQIEVVNKVKGYSLEYSNDKIPSNDLGRTVNLNYPFIATNDMPDDKKYIHVLAIDENDKNSEPLTLEIKDFKTINIDNNKEKLKPENNFDIKELMVFVLGSVLILSGLVFGTLKYREKKKEKNEKLKGANIEKTNEKGLYKDQEKGN